MRQFWAAACLALLGCGGDAGGLLPSAGHLNHDSIRCGWVKREALVLEPLEAGSCWLIDPETDDRASSYEGAEPCEVVNGPQTYEGGAQLRLWNWYGTGEHAGKFRTSVIACE